MWTCIPALPLNMVVTNHFQAESEMRGEWIETEEETLLKSHLGRPGLKLEVTVQRSLERRIKMTGADNMIICFFYI